MNGGLLKIFLEVFCVGGATPNFIFLRPKGGEMVIVDDNINDDNIDDELVLDKHYRFLLKKFGNKIPERIKVLWDETKKILKGRGLSLGKEVRIDKESFKNAILDYFTDVARIKELHNIKIINMNKLYAYEMYWLLRRRPVQCIVPIKDSLDLNEKVILGIFIPKILEEAGFPYKPETQNEKTREHMNTFTNLLFYNFKYRQYTPQSLELMIEAFLCGCNISK